MPLLLPRQLKLLRLLNEPAVMGSDKAKSQRMPGRPAIGWLEGGLVDFMDEPSGLKTQFRGPGPREYLLANAKIRAGLPGGYHRRSHLLCESANWFGKVGTETAAFWCKGCTESGPCPSCENK